MQIVQVPATHAQALWHLAAPLLAKPISYTYGATSADRTLAEVVADRKQLWFVAPDEGKGNPIAAGITSLQLNDDGTKTANIELLGGEDMKLWFSLKADFEAWAKVEGCNDVRMWTRKGMAKYLPDYDLTHYVLRKVLT